MKKCLLLVLLLSSAMLFVSSQAESWTELAGNQNGQGPLVTGQTPASNISSPSVVWSKTYPDIAGLGRWVLQTTDGGYLLLCAYGDSVFSLLKTDSQGNPLWNQSYSVEISGYGQNVVQTSDGGFAVAATYQKCFLLLKLDESGNQQWNRSYTVPGTRSARVIIQTQDGGYALLGTGTQQATPPESSVVAWLVKTDSEGKLEWTQNLGTNPPKSLVQTTDGGYAITKEVCFNLVKLDSNGSIEGNRTYVNRDMNEVNCVVQTSDGGFALAGYMWRRVDGGNPYCALVKTDASGVEQWVQYYGVGNIGSMSKTVDDGFVLAASNRLVKVGADGMEQWEINVGDYVIQTQDGGYALTRADKITDSTWGVGLAKLNRDPALPPVSPTPTEFPSSNPENNLAPSNLILELIVAVVVVVGASVVLLVWRRTHR